MSMFNFLSQPRVDTYVLYPVNSVPVRVDSDEFKNCVSKNLLEISGKNFVLKAYSLSKKSFNQTIHWDGASLEDLLKLTALTYAYGSEDEGKRIPEILLAAKSSNLHMGCGNIAKLVEQVLTHAKIESRLVAAYTRESFNGYDDSHTLLEIRHYDNWLLYDPTFACFFEMAGKRVGLLELCERRAKGELFYVSQIAQPVFSTYKFNGERFDFWVEERFRSSLLRDLWYERVLGIPLLFDGKLFYFLNEMPVPGKPGGNHYFALSREELLKKFY